MSKVLEKVVQKQLVQYLESLQIVPNEQFAFRKAHSTEDCLVFAVDRFLENKDSKKHTGVVLVDMSKAFDKVNHSALLHELFEIGVHSTALKWCRSYLTDRFQSVHLPGKPPSRRVNCQCGVPQGSVLGPVLFSLYTRKVPQLMLASKVNCQLFADDIMLDCSHADVSHINQQLSDAVSALAAWLASRGLILNESKTQVLAISGTREDVKLDVCCNSTLLSQSNTAKYLGVTLDSKLSWSAHVDVVVRRVSATIRSLWRIRRHLTTTAARRYYCAVISPLMLYGSNCFYAGLSCKDQDRIHRLAKRAIRCVAKESPLAPSAPLFRQLDVQPPKQLGNAKLACLMRRCKLRTISSLICDRVASAESTSDSRPTTRGSLQGNYVIPAYGSTCGSHRPLAAAVEIWNNLPACAKSSKCLTSFKGMLSALGHQVSRHV